MKWQLWMISNYQWQTLLFPIKQLSTIQQVKIIIAITMLYLNSIFIFEKKSCCSITNENLYCNTGVKRSQFSGRCIARTSPRRFQSIILYSCDFRMLNFFFFFLQVLDGLSPEEATTASRTALDGLSATHASTLSGSFLSFVRWQFSISKFFFRFYNGQRWLMQCVYQRRLLQARKQTLLTRSQCARVIRVLTSWKWVCIFIKKNRFN